MKSLLLLVLLAQVQSEVAVEVEATIQPPPSIVSSSCDFGLCNGLVDEAQFLSDKEYFGRKYATTSGRLHTSCNGCHFVPSDGGSSQVLEHRLGVYKDGRFAGGRLLEISPGAGSPAYSRRPEENVVSVRVSTSLYGLGYVECLPNEVLIENVRRQPAALRGELTACELYEAPGVKRIGRFGWKCQSGSVTSSCYEACKTSLGIASVRIDDESVTAQARFVRSLSCPPRCESTDARVLRGEQVFTSIGCAACHTKSYTTCPPGTKLNGGTFIVPESLGSRQIFPYSDFALHDLGKDLCDGIIQVGPPSTMRKVRTAPLWGLRTRVLLTHKGLAITRRQAILMHGGEALVVKQSFERLSAEDQTCVLAFLGSL